MDDRKLLFAGGAGSVIAAVCCFTPLLLIVLPAIGLATWLAWLDYVLLPLLAFSLAVTAIAALRLYRKRKTGRAAP
ncbi:hypothetical protein CKO28_19705 [Rhodovibrio sodomensis]|uniref:Mercury resistance system transport protein MerF n=1 Tax=Rhodovibrio sodomensis TaxID=1088 RepID=A0ABS1DJ73_9PROT|nr:mercury resistance system transport protein MerF [Rhodovibrio sodomensis]MBK1670259.1 hypothetical protein [Rhodovibrio sodomensis]